MMKYLPGLLILLGLCGIAGACPFCADTIRNTDAQTSGNLGSAMDLSIYFMFAGFFFALALVARAVVKGMGR